MVVLCVCMTKHSIRNTQAPNTPHAIANIITVFVLCLPEEVLATCDGKECGASLACNLHGACCSVEESKGTIIYLVFPKDMGLHWHQFPYGQVYIQSLSKVTHHLF